MTCAGCGWTAPPLDPRPFRCPHAGMDDVDHVLARRLENATPLPFFDSEPNPFIRYRTFTHAWHTAQATGMSDGEFVELVRALDAHAGGFAVTPLERRNGFWVKDETGNVAGSHKSRHLMGLMLWLLVAERIDPSLAHARLAIASCGNAALAAATIARAAKREIDVYVPDEASPSVIARLETLGANVTRCTREPGLAGDPAYLRFREAVARGALPFTCQGNENGLVIEGGQTLGWELASQLAASGTTLDHLFIQVGGGALASATIAGLEEARALGVLARMPRIHAVQTLASPLRRAYDGVLECGIEEAIGHRSRFMWPWETAPHSIATGILDDETYDWAAVLRGVLSTGGSVITVSEDELREANRIAGDGVSATGSAGLAGALSRQRMDESVGVLFTGASVEHSLSEIADTVQIPSR
ncbi:MAG TPA: pyridoxal-phosphate dependent enzyme [Thermoanaerobaculia bacterium]|nr:pyridoxal-phosphate dependent enzyme [Thermoanaerobaculia bacterium]